MSKSLYFEEFGQAGSPTLVFLHGLLGSSRNWRSVAKALSARYRIFTLDLPEHGNSPHHPSTDLQEMSGQVSQWIEQNIAGEYLLCGHSLGGKVAMRIACHQPARIQGLVVVDIAPRDYPPEHHLPTFEALLSLDLSTIQSRKQADEILSGSVPNWAFRQFLLTNLVEQSAGGWGWRVNLSTLHQSLPMLSSNPLNKTDSYQGPALFVRGGKSGYLRSEHFPLVLQAFPSAEIVTLPEAGHDVHVEDREGFVHHLEEFLQKI